MNPNLTLPVSRITFVGCISCTKVHEMHPTVNLSGLNFSQQNCASNARDGSIHFSLRQERYHE